MAKQIGTKRINGTEKTVYEGGVSGRKLTVWTRAVGQHFGTEAVVKHGRTVVHTTRVYPYGFTGPAVNDAEAEIDNL